MTKFDPGMVVIVKFPFTNLESKKQRPALVLSQIRHTEEIDIVNVAMITSKIDSYKIMGDVMVQDWQSSNLLFPSIVRLSKIATIDASIIPKILGKLSEKDISALKKMFAKLFDFWIPET